VNPRTIERMRWLTRPFLVVISVRHFRDCTDAVRSRIRAHQKE
jgi:hypothetical protein